ncbi:hypothetical protein GWI33_022233, partial [Rhynchophorus ferrugineus]
GYRTEKTANIGEYHKSYVGHRLAETEDGGGGGGGGPDAKTSHRIASDPDSRTFCSQLNLYLRRRAERETENKTRQRWQRFESKYEPMTNDINGRGCGGGGGTRGEAGEDARGRGGGDSGLDKRDRSG